MSVSLCVGEYSTTPYQIPGLNIYIHCLEELCFCIKENAFLLDEAIMNRELTDYLEVKLGEKELGRELWKMVTRQCTLESFCGTILKYTGLYNAREIHRTLDILKGSEGLTGIEKQKKQADFLLGKKKYVAAIRNYDAMLEQWNLPEYRRDMPAASVKAAICHNKGVALACMMLYEQAAAMFLEAYSLEGDKEECRAYLAAKRMYLSEEEYIQFVASLPEYYEETIALEKTMEEVRESYVGSVAHAMLAERQSRRMGNDKQEYYQENDTLPQFLKNNYRNNVSE